MLWHARPPVPCIYVPHHCIGLSRLGTVHAYANINDDHSIKLLRLSKRLSDI